MTTQIAAATSATLEPLAAGDDTARPGFVSAAAAAEFLSVSPATVSRLITKGVLPAESIGRRKIVPVDALQALVDHAMADFDVERLIRSL